MQPRTRRLLTAVAIASLATTSASALVLGDPIVNPANGHTYYLLSRNTWAASEAEAVTLGGHLVTINDADENQWVHDTFATLDGESIGLWIGLTDEAEEGNFTWVSGEPVTYTNWANLEPSAFENENYAHIIHDSAFPIPPELGIEPAQWNDRPDADFVEFYDGRTAPAHGVVEVIPSISLPGDTDGDGDIDDFDLLNAISNFTGSLEAGVGGKGVPEGDTDTDADVDDFDLLTMISGFTGSLSAPAVPEPAGLGLLTLAGLMALRRRR